MAAPMTSSSICPASSSSTRGAISSCSSRTRSAEQRWPALLKAEVTLSRTTCSGSAELSTIITLMPPVSAISVAIAPDLPASRCSIRRAVWVEPVKTTPAMRASPVSASPTAGPPGSSCSTSAGMPARCNSSTARAAVSGVCSAGLATTLLPVTSAALTCPVKMDTGKFQGLMQANTPRPRTRSVLRSPVGPVQQLRSAEHACLRRRSNAGNRSPRGPRRRCRARYGAASSTHRAINSARCVSNSSAARSRIAARSDTGRRSHAGWAAPVRASARATCSAVASPTGAIAGTAAAHSVSSAPSSRPSAKLTPRELGRWLPKSCPGVAIRGSAAGSV